jgi:hypothetical protein
MKEMNLMNLFGLEDVKLTFSDWTRQEAKAVTSLVDQRGYNQQQPLWNIQNGGADKVTAVREAFSLIMRLQS